VVLNVRNNFHADIRIDVSRFHESKSLMAPSRLPHPF